jgi:hypothetical protein
VDGAASELLWKARAIGVRAAISARRMAEA